MPHIVILGAGTAGTTAATMLVKQEALKGWDITVIDRNNEHDYQPG